MKPKRNTFGTEADESVGNVIKENEIKALNAGELNTKHQV